MAESKASRPKTIGLVSDKVVGPLANCLAVVRTLLWRPSSRFSHKGLHTETERWRIHGLVLDVALNRLSKRRVARVAEAAAQASRRCLARFDRARDTPVSE